jgi:periplasmic copper chaperone A
MLNTIKLIAYFLLSTSGSLAFSHVNLEQQSAETSTTTKAVLRVGHGCEGLPTAVLRVQIPEGFQGSKPMPKAGWTLTVIRTPLAKPYNNHGKAVTDDVSEVIWTASSREMYLADAHYDEFVLRGKTPETPGPLWFKVTQQCKEGDKVGQNAWTEVPAMGTSVKGLDFPAALLQVNTPASAVKPPEHKH